MTPRRLQLDWPRLAAVLLLIGVAADRAAQPAPADASAYHARVRCAAGAVPMNVGNWVGKKVPVPDAAVKMLSPNVMMNRHYVNVTDGQEANMLLVQCGDARDIVVHYPPICYCNAGWTLIQARPHDWTVDDLHIEGCEYHFAKKSLAGESAMVVDDFILLPDGQTVRDMEAVDAAAGDVGRRYFGAAQVQVLTSAALPPQRREQIFHTLVGTLSDTIKAIGSGAAQ